MTICINQDGFKEHIKGWTPKDVGSLVLFIVKHRHPDILPEMFPGFISSTVISQEEAAR
jgi:hypothetical protein